SAARFLTGPVLRTAGLALRYAWPKRSCPMSNRSVFALVALGAIAAIVSTHHAVLSPVVHAQSQQAGTTTLDDQTELAVTVYNSDIALVRDVRNLDLAR